LALGKSERSNVENMWWLEGWVEWKTEEKSRLFRHKRAQEERAQTDTGRRRGGKLPKEKKGCQKIQLKSRTRNPRAVENGDKPAGR